MKKIFIIFATLFALSAAFADGIGMSIGGGFKSSFYKENLKYLFTQISVLLIMCQIFSKIKYPKFKSIYLNLEHKIISFQAKIKPVF